MEDYAAKMLLKTDAALREYVTGHVQYREAAVLAALDELRRRGQPAPEEAALRPGLEAGAAAQRTLDEAAEAERQQTAAPEATAAEETGPALFSPGTILMFSLFFSMLAGGVLLGLNLARLRRWGALVGLGLFLAAYLVASTLAMNWLVARFGLNPLLSLALNVPAILAYLLWFWPRYVGAEPYRSRGWLLVHSRTTAERRNAQAAGQVVPRRSGRRAYQPWCSTDKDVMPYGLTVYTSPPSSSV
jgi:hypothetical protein